MKSHAIKCLLIICLFVPIVSCSQKPPVKENLEVKNRRDTILADAAKLRINWTNKLRKMTIDQLAQQLSKESTNGMESFNSMAFKELVSRPSNKADSILAVIEQARNRSSLLNLLAVRRINVEVYRRASDGLKATVLVDALKNAKTFNNFGLPHVRWEEAAQAIIEAGDSTKWHFAYC